MDTNAFHFCIREKKIRAWKEVSCRLVLHSFNHSILSFVLINPLAYIRVSPVGNYGDNNSRALANQTLASTVEWRQ